MRNVAEMEPPTTERWIMDPEDQTYLRGYMQWRASHRGSKLKSDLVMRGDDLGATLGDSDHVADYPIISISRNEG